MDRLNRRVLGRNQFHGGIAQDKQTEAGQRHNTGGFAAAVYDPGWVFDDADANVVTLSDVLQSFFGIARQTAAAHRDEQ
ncbi:MAG: hypothetical protein JOZ62_17055 [Acidobacteriaceae bacterium]|nr:hypothetical protein [Acidobacteriaceae bacterium]